MITLTAFTLLILLALGGLAFQQAQTSPQAQQSLGDFWWTRRNSVNWGQAWPHYQQALEWWAASSDIDLARRR